MDLARPRFNYKFDDKIFFLNLLFIKEIYRSELENWFFLFDLRLFYRVLKKKLSMTQFK